MKEVLINALKGNWWFYILMGFSIALITASFIVPPLGIVDPSVMASVGELFAFGGLGALLKAIDNGTHATVKHSGTEITVNKEKEK